MQTNFRESIAYLRGKGVLSDDESGYSPEAWHEAMTRPLDPKIAKYVKALQRMGGCVPTMYFAVNYEDATSLAGSSAKIAIKPEDGESWAVMKELNRLSAALNNYTLPEMPTRECIRENIEMHRKDARKPTAIDKDMVQQLTEVYAAARVEPDKRVLEETADLRDAWYALMQSKVGDGTFHGACTARDGAALSDPAVWGPHSALAGAAAIGRAEFWDALNSLNGTIGLLGKLPKSLMRAVEEQASNFAGADTGPLELGEAIRSGQRVIETLSPDDLQELANSAHELFPMLMQQGQSALSPSNQASLLQMACGAGTLPGLPP